MSALVVDASAAASALLAEEYGSRVLGLLADADALHVPDLFYAEIGNVLWKHCRRGALAEDEARELLSDVQKLPLTVESSDRLVGLALELAIDTRCTVYDCLYLALAIRMNVPLLTGNRRLVNALVNTPLADRVIWIGQSR